MWNRGKEKKEKGIESIEERKKRIHMGNKR